MSYEYNPWEGSYKVQASKINKARAKIKEKMLHYEDLRKGNENDNALMYFTDLFLADLKKIDSLLLKGE